MTPLRSGALLDAQPGSTPLQFLLVTAPTFQAYCAHEGTRTQNGIGPSRQLPTCHKVQAGISRILTEDRDHEEHLGSLAL
jgi:hypothetical protein